MKALTAELETCMEDVYALRFFYSFQIPRLGKEFDLLQIKEDQIINIELKSGVVSDEPFADSFCRTVIICRCLEERFIRILISAARTVW